MTKKKPVIEQKNNFLSPLEVYKWLHSQQTVLLAKEELKNTEMQVRLMEKDIEIASLRKELYKFSKLAAKNEAVAAAGRAYNDMQASLSVDIKGKIINEHTGEVLDESDLI